MKIALTIPTGRPRVRQVSRAFVENAIQHGYSASDISIYLSIDTTFNDTRTRDFHVGKRLEEKVGNVVYITPRDRVELARNITNETGADPVVINDLFAGRGYSRLRNSALLHAIKDGNDIAICIDDDEAPIIPVERDDGKIEWKTFDFFGPHMMMLVKEADITRGPYLGYLSPIPSGLEKEVPERIRKALGAALSTGNEVINPDSFLNLMSKIKYLPSDEVINPSRPFIAEDSEYGKHVWAGNMGLNLESVRSGKVPIFYTPPNARGEDTIFALQISGLTVAEVPSYIFHDPFDKYSGVFKGKYPERLREIPVTEKSRERFADALIGWLKYAPMLVQMTSKNSQERDERLTEMISRIESPTKMLAGLLDCPRLGTCKAVLQEYTDNVSAHYDGLLRAQSVWRESILPVYSGMGVGA